MNPQQKQNTRTLRGISGLANLGNTCFINSCIQILSHTHELNNLLDDSTIQLKLNKQNPFDVLLLNEWDILRKLMWSQNCTISPGRFIKQLQNISIHKEREEFSNFSQNDSSEFFLFMIDCLHSALSRQVNIDITGIPNNELDLLAVSCYKKMKEMYNKDYSEIYDMFYGIHVSQIISLDEPNRGSVLSNTPEPFSIINLPIPQIKQPSLIDCLELYLQGEILDGDNAWYNENTKTKQSIQKQIIYWSLPKILVIDIKRFNPYNYRNKNQVHISFPLNNLDLSKYVIGYSPNQYIYDLYAICNHHGGTLGGHYYSFIRVSNKWFCFNDTTISEITNIDQLITPNAYLFFYRKREKNN